MCPAPAPQARWRNARGAIARLLSIYGRYDIQYNWAVKFYIDALLLLDRQARASEGRDIRNAMHQGAAGRLLPYAG